MKKRDILFTLVLLSIVMLILKSGFSAQYKPYKQKDEYPDWLKELIAREEIGKVANPPASIWKCIYKSQIVYYLPSRCCDITSVLFTEKGDPICHSDGGLTGRGDEKCPDFFQERKNCELVWKDSRSYP